MNFLRLKRLLRVQLAGLLILVAGLLLPTNSALADPNPPPVAPPNVDTYIPKPKEPPNPSAAQLDTPQAEPSAPLIGTKTDTPKPKRVPTNDSATPNVSPAAAWSVTMTSSNYYPFVGRGFTLTAFANQDVGPTLYYIRIYLGSTRYASCGYGTSCSVTLFSNQAGANYTFQARIEDYFGIFVQARYNVGVRVLAPWTLSLFVSRSNPNMNQPYTLTAYVNQDVGPTPYFIEIYRPSLAPRAICGIGRSCSVTLSWRLPQVFQYQARVSRYDGSNIQVLSNIVTVNVQIPSVYRLTTINVNAFQTQMGSAGDLSVGSLNCGPASAAMVINYWKGLPSGESATGQPYETARAAANYIRGGSQNNVPHNAYGTDFKGTPTLNLLSQFGLLHKNLAVNSYNYMRQEIASGHPVIILVNNNQYQVNAPYPQLGSGAWTKSHIVVVTGYDATNVYINDPLRQATSPTLSPQDFPLPIATFRLAASAAVNGASITSEGNWYAMSVYP